jgi:hypothetical protein
MRKTFGFLAALLIAAGSSANAGVFTGIDGMSSTVFQEGQSSFSGIALRAHLHPETMISELDLMPSIEYWRNSNTIQPYDIHTMRKDATLAMDVRYRFSMGNWQPYAGMGFGIHFLSTRVNAPSLGLNEATDSVIKGGLAALGGLTFGMTSRFDNFIEFKYHHIPDYRQLKINWGLSYKL